jgi:hypothetical protein
MSCTVIALGGAGNGKSTIGNVLLSGSPDSNWFEADSRPG